MSCDATRSPPAGRGRRPDGAWSFDQRSWSLLPSRSMISWMRLRTAEKLAVSSVSTSARAASAAGWRSRADDAPRRRAEDEHAIGEVDGLVDVVRDVDDRDAGRARRRCGCEGADPGAPRASARRPRRTARRAAAPAAARRAPARSRRAAASRPRASTDTSARRPARPTSASAASARAARSARVRPIVRSGNVDVPHDVEPRKERAAVVLEDDGELARRTQDRPPVEAAPRPRSLASGRRGTAAASSCRSPDGPTIASSSPASTSK